MPLCVRLITHPPRPYLPDPFIQLQSVMYLWYSVCCTGCCSCLAHMLLFLVQKFDKWQQVCTDLKKIPNHSHPTHLSHLICCSLPVLSCCSEIFFFFFDRSRLWVFLGTSAAQWQAWSSWNTRPAPSGPLSFSLSHSVVGWRVTSSGKRCIH